MKGSVRLDGGADLARALSGLSARVSTRLIRESLIEAAEPMRDRMEQLVPVSDDAPHVRDEMVISKARSDTDARETAVAVGPTKKGFYGSFVEFGTAHMAAQPWARPAFDQTWLQSLGIFAAALWRELAGRGIRRSMADAPTKVQDEV